MVKIHITEFELSGMSGIVGNVGNVGNMSGICREYVGNMSGMSGMCRSYAEVMPKLPIPLPPPAAFRLRKFHCVTFMVNKVSSLQDLEVSPLHIPLR